MRTCPECGKELKPDQLLCQCGTAVGVLEIDPGDLGSISIDLPNLNFQRPRLPALDLSLSGTMSVPLPSFDIPKPAFKIDLRAQRRIRSQPFRVVIAIGGSEDAAVKLNCPVAVACLADRNFLVLDLGDDRNGMRIQQFDLKGDLQKVVRRSAGGGPMESAQVPAAMTVDDRGHLFVSDMDAGCIQEYKSGGAWVASHGHEGMADGDMSSPRAIAVDATGSIFVADSGNNRIVRWSQGLQYLVAGINRLDEAEGWLQAGDGPAQFDDPQGLALGPNGNLFVADTNNHRIQILDASGKFLHAFGSEGEEAGHFSYPSHVRTGPNAVIYVADLGGRRLQTFNPKGEYSYEIILPAELGALADFAVDVDGRILLAFRSRHAVIGIEVE